MFNPLDFSHEREITSEELVRRVEAYYPDADFEMLKKPMNTQLSGMRDKSEVAVKIILFTLLTSQLHLLSFEWIWIVLLPVYYTMW